MKSAVVSKRVKLGDLEPFPNNPVSPERVARMGRARGGFDSSVVGSLHLFDNSSGAYPEYPADTLLIGDGNHRHHLAADHKQLDTEVVALVHRGLTRAAMHRTRRGLNDRRTVKPAEVFLHRAEEGHKDETRIKETIEGLGWEITQLRGPRRLSCTNELRWIWQRDQAALVRAVQTFERAFGREPSKHSTGARVIKGIGAFWVKHPDADMDRLVASMKGMSSDGLYRSGKSQNDDNYFIKSVWAGIRYVLVLAYNKGRRKGQLAL